MKRADFSQLEAFVAVAERCNFKEAAAQLGIAPSTLSQTIRALEERLDVRLLNRTTRSVSLTHAGTELLARLKPALRSIDDALASANDVGKQAAGPLRVAASRAAARLVMAPMMGAFTLRYPHIRLELRVDDTLADIVSGQFDAGIRVGHLLEQDMVALRLTPDLPIRVVAAPDYLARHGVPQMPLDLRSHNCIRTAHATTGAIFPWRFRQDDGAPLELLPTGTPTVNDEILTLAPVLDGTGIGYLLAADVQAHIDSGALVSLLENWTVALPGFHVYYPRNRHMPAALRAFLDFLKERRAAVD